MKMSNFQRLDPEFHSRGRVGLPHGAKGEVAVWERYHDDRRGLAAMAKSIRTVIEELPEALAADPPSHEAAADGDEGGSEATLLARLHTYRERNTKVVRDRKMTALAKRGRLVCEGCGFDYRAPYGDRGRGYIEAHHTTALELLEPGTKTKQRDLALICANCHRIIHARRPWLTMEELKACLQAQAIGGRAAEKSASTAAPP